jgi:preprotein translocase subunit SecD
MVALLQGLLTYYIQKSHRSDQPPLEAGTTTGEISALLNSQKESGSAAKLEFFLVKPRERVEVGDDIKTVKERIASPSSEIDKGDIASASVSMDYGSPEVLIELTPSGTKKFFQLTKRAMGEQLAIIYNDKVIMTPVIREPISEGKLVITGGLSLEEAFNLAKAISPVAQ